jgi:NTE family protein
MEKVPITGEMRETVLEILGQSAWFRAFEDRAKATGASEPLNQVALMADLERFSPGELILREGFPSDAFFLLLRGEATVRLESRAGTELARLGPPESFGEVGLLLEETRTASVLAVEETLALRFGTNAFRTMMETIPHFGYETSRHLARRLKEFSEKLPAL